MDNIAKKHLFGYTAIGKTQCIAHSWQICHFFVNLIIVVCRSWIQACSFALPWDGTSNNDSIIYECVAIPPTNAICCIQCSQYAFRIVESLSSVVYKHSDYHYDYHYIIAILTYNHCPNKYDPTISHAFDNELNLCHTQPTEAMLSD